MTILGCTNSSEINISRIMESETEEELRDQAFCSAGLQTMRPGPSIEIRCPSIVISF